MENKWRPTKKWWRAYGALVGNGNVKSVKPELNLAGLTNPEPPKPTVPTEQQEQFIAVAWLQKNNIVCHHSPNGGYRDAREGAKFKRLGVSAGFPDLCLPYARKGYHGLYIELKRVSGGKLSDYQLWWRDFLIAQGYAWYEAKGAGECIEIVKNYLNSTEIELIRIQYAKIQSRVFF